MEALFKSRVGRVVSQGRTDFIYRDIPEPQGDQVVVKIEASAICGSDMHIFKAKHPSVSLPCTIGHEFSGTVAAVGPQAKNVSVGDRVTVEPCIVCGTCDACLRGDYGYCESISFTYREGDGAMADYITVKSPYVYRLPEHLSFEEGALIEPLAVATHAVRRADVRLGERVLVIGDGAIGILTAALCRRSGAGEVVVFGRSEQRLRIVREMGATLAVNTAEPGIAEEALERVTGGSGMDKTFECVGMESTFIQAMTSLRKNGLATIVGIFEEPNITIPAMRFINYEIKVQGAQGYCWDFPVALRMSRDIPLGKMVTHVFELDELQSALDTCFDQSAGSVKVLLKP